MDNKNYEDMNLPDLHAAITAAQVLIREVEESLHLMPDHSAAIIALQRAARILAHYNKREREAYSRYIIELQELIRQPDYPHSIKTWFEMEYTDILRDTGNEQE